MNSWNSLGKMGTLILFYIFPEMIRGEAVFDSEWEEHWDLSPPYLNYTDQISHR